MAAEIRHLLSHMVLPFSRAELPGWGRLAHPLGVFGVHNDILWKGLPCQPIRGKWHNYVMSLDLSNWSQRLTWFTGRFYELDTQLAIKALVKQGDTFIDVGANIGMITLLASRQIGKSGRVVSFEPNPNACTVLRESIRVNEIENVSVCEYALSDTAGTRTLSVVGDHDGVGTLASISDLPQNAEQYQIRSVPGDDILPDPLHGNVFIKIDVEGFEPFVLRGLEKTVDRYAPIILAEFEPKHLVRAESSPAELFDLLTRKNYKPFNIVVRPTTFAFDFQLHAASENGVSGRNIVWMKAARAGGAIATSFWTRKW